MESCNCKNTDLKDLGIDTSLLSECLEKYSKIEGSLITVLQTAQEIYGYLPTPLISHIANEMGIPPAKALGVVTFYTQFRTKPVGKHLILLCQGTACHVNGSGQIEEAIRAHIGCNDGDISDDGLFTYTNVACLGCCSLAPALMIGEKTYGNLNRAKTIEILENLKSLELESKLESKNEGVAQ